MKYGKGRRVRGHGKATRTRRRKRREGALKRRRKATDCSKQHTSRAPKMDTSEQGKGYSPTDREAEMLQEIAGHSAVEKVAVFGNGYCTIELTPGHYFQGENHRHKQVTTGIPDMHALLLVIQGEPE